LSEKIFEIIQENPGLTTSEIQKLHEPTITLKHTRDRLQYLRAQKRVEHRGRPQRWYVTDDIRSLIVGPNESDNEKFGQILQKFRTDNQLSRAKAANRIGVSSEYVRLMEKGERTPALGMARKILYFYGVPYTVTKNQIFCENISVEFTSRIKESRYHPKIEMTRNELMGEIVSLLSVADDKTVEKIHSKLLRSLLVKGN